MLIYICRSKMFHTGVTDVIATYSSLDISFAEIYEIWRDVPVKHYTDQR